MDRSSGDIPTRICGISPVDDMLGTREGGKASAYYSRKWSICNISANSIVYLYHTGVGVIAKGRATEAVKKASYANDVDEEFYVPLDFEWAVDKSEWDVQAIPAWEINSRLNSGHRFRQTVFTDPRRWPKR